MSTYNDLDEPRHSTPGVLVSKPDIFSLASRRAFYERHYPWQTFSILTRAGFRMTSYHLLYSVKEPVKGCVSFHSQWAIADWSISAVHPTAFWRYFSYCKFICFVQLIVHLYHSFLFFHITVYKTPGHDWWAYLGYATEHGTAVSGKVLINIPAYQFVLYQSANISFEVGSAFPVFDILCIDQSKE